MRRRKAIEGNEIRGDVKYQQQTLLVKTDDELYCQKEVISLYNKPSYDVVLLPPL